MNKDLEKLERLKANGIELNEYEETIMKEINEKKKYSRKGHRPKAYGELINEFKKEYYRNFYQKKYFVKWTTFANQTGLKYSLEKCYMSIDLSNTQLINAIISDPYAIKYMQWEY